MKGLVDTLHAIGIITSDNDLLLHILDGLGLEFDTIVVNLTARIDNVTLEEAQFQLQSYELRLGQFHTTQMVDLAVSEANFSKRSSSPIQRSF